MTETGFATPEDAEAAFYAAFQNADLKAMMAVWADREFIECIHPMSDRAQGRFAVQESWRQIFDTGVALQLELSNVHRTQDALLAVHVVYEHLSIPGQTQQHPPVIATNIYQLIDKSWHMVLHHASPSPVDEYSEYSDDDSVADDTQPQRLH